MRWKIMIISILYSKKDISTEKETFDAINIVVLKEYICTGLKNVSSE